MKKLIVLLYAVFSAILIVAQSPQSFQYQSVVRDGNGDVVINQPVSFQISLISGSATGTVMYVEIHSATTNAFGLVTLAIGNGIPQTGSMVNIDWASAPHFIKVEVDITGGTAYVEVGTTQLLSVPYALLSKTSEDAFSGNYSDLNGVPVYISSFSNDVGYITSPNDADADPANEMQTLSVAGNNLTIIGGNTVAIPQTTYTAGTGINVTGTTITNAAPDLPIILTGNGATTVTGTYPSFTVTSTDNVNDADADPTNELQSLSFINDTIFLSNGGFAPLSGYGDTLWRASGSNIYNNNTGKVGIGTATPPGKLVVQGDALLADTVPLFEVKDRTGATVFIVYPDSVRIYVDDDGSKTNKGTFAVSGRNTAKQFTHNYLLVKPDSTRIYTSDAEAGFGIENVDVSASTAYMKMTPDNYFIGHEAGKLNNTGLYNSFIGYQSGYNNIGGIKNYFIGYRSGYNNNGYSNIFFGDSTGFSNTYGVLNIFIGNQAGFNNTTGNLNIAIGAQAMFSNTTGNGNLAIGSNSMYHNATGNYNIAYGWYSFHSNTSGSNNAAIGINALYNNTTGDYNTACGNGALFMNSTGYENTAFGFSALSSNSTGYYNTSAGSNSLTRNNVGSNNVSVGYNTMYWNTAAGNNVAVGSEALYTQSYQISLPAWESDNVAVGYRSLYSNQPISITSGFRNTAVGSYSMYTNSTGSYNAVLGYNAFKNSQSGSRNVAVGANSLFSTVTSDNNTAIGYNAMYSNINGNQNTAAGMEASYSNTNGLYNTANGYQALYTNVDGDNNVAVGHSALFTNTGNDNTAVGYYAMYANTTGAQNVAVGNYALQNNTQWYNTAIGYNALKANTGGFDNTACGTNALTANTTGYFNTALGYNAFSTGTTYNNSMALGYAVAISASNQVRVGNNAVTSIGGQVSWTALSDGRFKTNVKENVPGLDFIMKLKPVTYNFDIEALSEYTGIPDSLRIPGSEKERGNMVQCGFIAQDVEKAASEAGFVFSGVDKPKNEKDYYGLRYAEFTVPLVKAVQELKDENTKLVKENLQQQIVIDQLIQRIEKLESKQ